MPEQWYGYYSAKAAACYGTARYQTLDGEVEVTLVNPSPDITEVRKTYLWDDTVELGPVGKCVRLNTDYYRWEIR